MISKSIAFTIVLMNCFFNSTLAGVMPKGSTWDHLDISVCWSPGDKDVAMKTTSYDPNDYTFILNLFDTMVTPPEHVQKSVKKLILSQYSYENTGIHFTGWEICDSVKKVDVVLFFSPMRMNGQSSLGNGLSYFEKSKGIPAIFLGISGLEELTEIDIHTIVHEFGHTSNLLHEDTIFKESSPEALFAFTKFDENSVMISGFGGGSAQTLSKGDIYTLRCMYRPELLPNGVCESEADLSLIEISK